MSPYGRIYWHFPNREALVAAALTLWEAKATENVITTVSAVADPVDRLRALLAEAFQDDVGSRADVAILALTSEPGVSEVAERVTERRLGFLVDLLGELGLSADEATSRARLALGSYIGWFALQRQRPNQTPSDRSVTATLRWSWTP